MKDDKEYIKQAKQDIDSMLAKKGYSLSSFVRLLNSKGIDETTSQNFSNKLSNGRIRYKDLLKYAEILGFKIEWREL